MEILTIETPSLGDRSYIVTDGRNAAVIDPQRDIDRVVALLDDRGLVLTDVFETHIHNDYLTGGLELARRYAATYHVGADDDVAFERHGVADGDVVVVGDVEIHVIHTPGHTPTHLSFAVHHGGHQVAVFTGGSMLYGSVGRTDLVSPEFTEQLTRHQFHSVRHLATLDDDTAVYPTHGFGSFCSSGETTGVDSSTIAQEKRHNQALTIDDEDRFVRELLAGLDAYPSYYAHMAPVNRQGPAPVDLSPAEPVDTVELLRRIHAGEWVIDLRNRVAFASDHVAGTINVELDDTASTHLGWLIPWGTPVTLVAETAEEVAQMQRQLVRIGIDRPGGQMTGGATAVDDDAPRSSYGVTDFAGLRKAIDAGDTPHVIDARRRLEWEDGHLAFAHHLPLHELLDRLHEVPSDRPVWIHCAGGYRSAIGASLLDRAGRQVVLIDDDFDTVTDHFPLGTVRIERGQAD